MQHKERKSQYVESSIFFTAWFFILAVTTERWKLGFKRWFHSFRKIEKSRRAEIRGQLRKKISLRERNASTLTFTYTLEPSSSPLAHNRDCRLWLRQRPYRTSRCRKENREKKIDVLNIVLTPLHTRGLLYSWIANPSVSALKGDWGLPAWKSASASAALQLAGIDIHPFHDVLWVGLLYRRGLCHVHASHNWKPPLTSRALKC